ncbi:MAG: flagellar motor switch protein FliG [Hyphomicrobium sp.]|nr:flagellar motor switch protein FliG [Hyphomicrobium sp.]
MPSLDKATMQRPSAKKPMTGAEKVGLLLLSLGQERAVELLKKFNSEELNIIMRSTDGMPVISAPDLELLVEEFEERFGQGKPFAGNGDDVKSLVAAVINENKAAADAADGNQSKEAVWERLIGLKDDVLLPYIERQHPQVAAFILHRLGSEKSTDLLRSFPADVRNQLLARIFGLRDVSFMVIDALEETLHQELFEADKGRASQHMAMASILNSLDRSQSDDALHHLAQFQPKDAAMIRKLLFKFEDLVTLSSKALTVLMDGVPVERTVIALQGMDAEFQNVVLGTLSPRARRMAEAELQSGTAASPRNLAESRRAIVDAVLRLAAEGAIELPTA